LILVGVAATDSFFVGLNYGDHSGMDWQSCGVIFAAITICMSFAFIASSKKLQSSILWTEPSWFQNPFQLRTQPLQFWHLCELNAIAAGVGGVLRNLIMGRYAQMPEPCVVLGMGLAIWIALRIWTLVCFRGVHA
jgi:hypothetical protein